MTKNSTGADLEAALAFQKYYAEAVCLALEVRFENNDVIDAFKVLNPVHMPHRQIGLASWGIVEFDLLLQ